MKPVALVAVVVSAAAAGAAYFLYQQRAERVEPPPPLATQAPVAQLAETVPQFQLADRMIGGERTTLSKTSISWDIRFGPGERRILRVGSLSVSIRPSAMKRQSQCGRR